MATVLLRTISLAKAFGARPLFNGISLSLFDGERTGLIGPNGSGKSTLLKILANEEHADTGEIETRRSLRVGYVPQDDRLDPAQTPEGLLHDALADIEHEEHRRHARVQIMLGRVGFERPDQAVGTLSGGWKKRLAIARALIAGPELLLLDEPTNHLDLEGILWLEKLLVSMQAASLIVSHDRYFLERITQRTIELNSAYPDGFFSSAGAYSEFLVKREEFLSAQRAQEQSLAGRVRREIDWLQRGAKARTTKAKYRIDAAGQMMDDLADLKTRNVQAKSAQVDFVATDRRTAKLMAAKGVSKSLGGKLLFEKLNLVLSPGQKLGILGPNGSGKSTLLNVLAGRMEADVGEVRLAEGLKVVMFDQAREQLERDVTLRRALSPTGDTIDYRGASMHVSSWAKRFLFRQDQLDMPVAGLSGGEQSRVLIARLMLKPADVLILDEPTNDLDIPTLEAMEESLEDFPGALVLVTHDRYLLDRLCTDLLALDGRGHAHLYGDYAQWEARMAEAKPIAAPRKEAPAPEARPAAARKKLTWNEQRELEQMEGAIMEAEETVEICHRQMEDRAVMADHVKLREVCDRMAAAQERVRHLYESWQQLEARKA